MIKCYMLYDLSFIELEEAYFVFFAVKLFAVRTQIYILFTS